MPTIELLAELQAANERIKALETEVAELKREAAVAWQLWLAARESK